MNQGTEALIKLAAEGRERAPHLLEFRDFRKSAEWMIKAASTIERLAPLEPDLQAEPGEN